jgi:hypothetical protein
MYLAGACIPRRCRRRSSARAGTATAHEGPAAAATVMSETHLKRGGRKRLGVEESKSWMITRPKLNSSGDKNVSRKHGKHRMHKITRLYSGF